MTHFNCPICKVKLAPGEGCDVIDGHCAPQTIRACPNCDAAMGSADSTNECRSCNRDTRKEFDA